MNQEVIYSFFDESGTDGKSEFLALGLIKVRDVVAFHKKLEEVRNNHHFRNEIKFEKISNLRASISKEWIDVFSEFQGIKFHSAVIEKQKAKVPLMNLKQWPRFKVYVKSFLDKYLKEENIRFYFDSYNPVQDRKFSEYLLTHIRGLKNIESVNSKDYDVLQICDLLLGTVRASFEKSITSPYKKEITQYLEKKLGIEQLDKVINKENFSVIKNGRLSERGE